MMSDNLVERFEAANTVAAVVAEGVIPDRPGYYAIYVDDPGSLPALFDVNYRPN